MSNQYGNSNKAPGQKGLGNPSPKKQDQAHFSNMAKVDVKEMHNKSIDNMSAKAGHVASMPISDHHSYKRQSHAAKPSGEIKSFVGGSGHKDTEMKVVKPDSDSDYDND